MKTAPEGIVRMAQQHVNIYEKRVEAGKKGHPNVRLDECEKLLALWKSVVAKGGKELNKEEQGEVVDAVFSGEYEDV